MSPVRHSDAIPPADYLRQACALLSAPAQGALVATVFIFLPGLLIAVAGVSLWSRLARHAPAVAALLLLERWKVPPVVVVATCVVASIGVGVLLPGG